MKQKMFEGFVKLVLCWTILALTFQVTMLTLSVVDPELETKVVKELTWKLDGTFNK